MTTSSAAAAPIAVIYHAKCPDGFGAAFAAWLRFGDAAAYIPAFYGEPAPDLAGHEVYIVDFSYPPQELRALEQRAERVIVLDHHESAYRQLRAYACCKQHTLLHFDMAHSGARLAWDHFHPGKPVPALVNYIEDRDLWSWKLEHTRAYLMQLDMLPLEFEAWKQVLEMDEAQTARFIDNGRQALAKYDSVCRNLADDALPLSIGPHAGLMLPLGGDLVSDVGNILALKSNTFAALWKVLPEGRVKVSLRAAPGFDLLPLASAFGGGGHPASASFSIPLARLPDLVAGSLALPG